MNAKERTNVLIFLGLIEGPSFDVDAVNYNIYKCTRCGKYWYIRPKEIERFGTLLHHFQVAHEAEASLVGVSRTDAGW